MSQKVTVTEILQRKSSGPKIGMLTAYDATMARLMDSAGADILLVGDSLGMVIQGLPTTLPVSLEEMCYHGRAVARGVSRAQVVVDLPFMSYQISPEQALASAGKLMREGSAEAVKLEGGVHVAPAIEKIVAAGIPVMGHVGLTPQSVHAMGGFKVQGRTEDTARRIWADVKALESAGAYSVVLEGMPSELAHEITAGISIPTIGIGAGPGCDGQVLVAYDFLGLFEEMRPKFVKRYAELGAEIRRATQAYLEEVRAGSFPAAEHSFGAGKTKARAPSEATSTSSLGKQAAYGPGDEDV